jgi:HK97 family phage major capsid protein
MPFTARNERAPADNRLAREIPEEVVQDIIKDAEQTSVALQVGNMRRMRAYQTRLRIQETFPEAYWINGTTSEGDAPLGSANDDDTDQVAKDSGLKRTTNFQFTNAFLTPDELAVMATMPDNWRADSDLAWEELRTALRTAFAKAIDRAVFFGTSAHGSLPSSFGAGVVNDAITAGNVTFESGPGVVDLADAYAETAQKHSETGYDVTRFLTRAAEIWRLRRLRDSENRPIYTEVDASGSGRIWGLPHRDVTNGAWDQVLATSLVGDYSQLHIGIRQDMSWALSNSAIITDEDGNILYNAYQQDGEVLRVVMRMGYVVTDPIKHLSNERTYPFRVLRPGTS